MDRVYLAGEYGRPYSEIDVCRDTESGLLSERRDLNESKVYKVHKVQSNNILSFLRRLESSMYSKTLQHLFDDFLIDGRFRIFFEKSIVVSENIYSKNSGMTNFLKKLIKYQ